MAKKAIFWIAEATLLPLLDLVLILCAVAGPALALALPLLWLATSSRWTSLFQKLPLLLHVLIPDQEVLVGEAVLALLRQLRRDQLHQAVLQ